jgi:hypothetical protein
MMEEEEWKDVVADLWKSAWELGFLPMADDAVEGLETRQHVAHAQDKSPQDFIEGEIRLHLHELLDLSREERDQVVKEWRIGKPGPATCTAWEAEISSLNSDIEYLTYRINRMIGLARAASGEEGGGG